MGKSVNKMIASSLVLALAISPLFISENKQTVYGEENVASVTIGTTTESYTTFAEAVAAVNSSKSTSIDDVTLTVMVDTEINGKTDMPSKPCTVKGATTENEGTYYKFYATDNALYLNADTKFENICVYESLDSYSVINACNYAGSEYYNVTLEDAQVYNIDGDNLDYSNDMTNPRTLTIAGTVSINAEFEFNTVELNNSKLKINNYILCKDLVINGLNNLDYFINAHSTSQYFLKTYKDGTIIAGEEDKLILGSLNGNKYQSIDSSDINIIRINKDKADISEQLKQIDFTGLLSDNPIIPWYVYTAENATGETWYHIAKDSCQSLKIQNTNTAMLKYGASLDLTGISVTYMWKNSDNNQTVSFDDFDTKDIVVKKGTAILSNNMEVTSSIFNEGKNTITVTDGIHEGTVDVVVHNIHTGGVATCHSKAICSICNEEYGEFDSNNHDGGTEVRGALAATETSEGYTGDTYCLGCGQKISSGTTIPKLPSETTTLETTTPATTTQKVTEAISLDLNEDTIVKKNDSDLKGSSFQALQMKAKKSTKSSISIVWKKVKDADGYIVYGNRCGIKNKYQKIKTVSKNTIQFTQKKLKKNTYYKYFVVAYKTVDGNKQAIVVSKTIHISTQGGKNGNATSVKVNKSSLKLKVNKKFKIVAKEVNKKINEKIHIHRKCAFESDNTDVATVTKKGVVKAIAPGKCVIYVYAQNGVCKKVNITVK